MLTTPSLLLATPVANMTTLIMNIGERLASHTCPSCGRPMITAQWTTPKYFSVNCSCCRFAMDNAPDGSRQGHDPPYVNVAGGVGQNLLLTLFALRTLKRVEKGMTRAVLELAEQGAIIRPGDLDVEVRQMTGTTITQDLIKNVLGQQALTTLRQHAARRVIKQLHLRPFTRG